jgi:signal transduction histidine kinase
LIDYEKKGMDDNGLANDIDYLKGLSLSIRKISYDLIPNILPGQGLIRALKSFVSKIDAGRRGSAVFTNKTHFVQHVPFTKSEELTIYNMCLEIFNNLHKHAKFNYLRFDISEKDNYLYIIFAHDGASITNEEIEKLSKTGKGIGLKYLHSKALLLKGNIDYSKDDSVSYITFKIPFSDETYH